MEIHLDHAVLLVQILNSLNRSVLIHYTALCNTGLINVSGNSFRSHVVQLTWTKKKKTGSDLIEKAPAKPHGQ